MDTRIRGYVDRKSALFELGSWRVVSMRAHVCTCSCGIYERSWTFLCMPYLCASMYVSICVVPMCLLVCFYVSCTWDLCALMCVSMYVYLCARIYVCVLYLCVCMFHLCMLYLCVRMYGSMDVVWMCALVCVNALPTNPMHWWDIIKFAVG